MRKSSGRPVTAQGPAGAAQKLPLAQAQPDGLARVEGRSGTSTGVKPADRREKNASGELDGRPTAATASSTECATPIAPVPRIVTKEWDEAGAGDSTMANGGTKETAKEGGAQTARKGKKGRKTKHLVDQGQAGGADTTSNGASAHQRDPDLGHTDKAAGRPTKKRRANSGEGKPNWTSPDSGIEKDASGGQDKVQQGSVLEAAGKSTTEDDSVNRAADDSVTGTCADIIMGEDSVIRNTDDPVIESCADIVTPPPQPVNTAGGNTKIRWGRQPPTRAAARPNLNGSLAPLLPVSNGHPATTVAGKRQKVHPGDTPVEGGAADEVLGGQRSRAASSEVEAADASYDISGDSNEAKHDDDAEGGMEIGAEGDVETDDEGVEGDMETGAEGEGGMETGAPVLPAPPQQSFSVATGKTAAAVRPEGLAGPAPMDDHADLLDHPLMSLCTTEWTKKPPTRTGGLYWCRTKGVWKGSVIPPRFSSAWGLFRKLIENKVSKGLLFPSVAHRKVIALSVLWTDGTDPAYHVDDGSTCPTGLGLISCGLLDGKGGYKKRKKYELHFRPVGGEGEPLVVTVNDHDCYTLQGEALKDFEHMVMIGEDGATHGKIAIRVGFAKEGKGPVQGKLSFSPSIDSKEAGPTGATGLQRQGNRLSPQTGAPPRTAASTKQSEAGAETEVARQTGRMESDRGTGEGKNGPAKALELARGKALQALALREKGKEPTSAPVASVAALPKVQRPPRSQMVMRKDMESEASLRTAPQPTPDRAARGLATEVAPGDGADILRAEEEKWERARDEKNSRQAGEEAAANAMGAGEDADLDMEEEEDEEDEDVDCAAAVRAIEAAYKSPLKRAANGQFAKGDGGPSKNSHNTQGDL